MKFAPPPTRSAAAPSYHIEEDSDEYGALSSADEAEDDPMLVRLSSSAKLLHWCNSQLYYLFLFLQNQFKVGQEEEEEDDFEKEMDAEVQQGMPVKLQKKKETGKETGKDDDKFYDDIYFASRYCSFQ